MASIPLPDGTSAFGKDTGDNDPIHRELFDRHRIEVPVIAWPSPPKRLLRISAQIYNTARDYEDLAGALGEILSRGKPGQ
jgi:isopenicillin-N epimerase